MDTKEILKIADTTLEGNDLLKVKLARKDGQTLLYVKATENLTKHLQTGVIRESDNWGTEFSDSDSGYKFHKKSGYSDEIRSFTTGYKDDYGHKFIQSGNVNIAVLRTEGIEDGKFFEINQPLTEKNLRKIVKGLKEFADDYRDRFLKDVAFIGEIREIEVDNTVQTAFNRD